MSEQRFTLVHDKSTFWQKSHSEPSDPVCGRHQSGLFLTTSGSFPSGPWQMALPQALEVRHGHVTHFGHWVEVK